MSGEHSKQFNSPGELILRESEHLMQLPGMSYDPVRLSLDVTWWPDEDGFGVSRRLWTRPHRGDRWQLEDMATSGSLFRLCSLPEQWAAASDLSLRYFEDLMRVQGDPF